MTTDNPTSQTKTAGAKPDFIVKSASGYGRGARFNRIGAGWSRPDGGVCVRLDGKQLIENDLYLFPAVAAESGAQ